MESFTCRLFCCDYDETLADEGSVHPLSLEALRKLKSSGRKILLVTGRIMSYLLTVFPDIAIFDLVVAENGGTIYHPGKTDEKMLTTPPAGELVAALEKAKVPFSIGRTIVASHVPYEKTILQMIRDLGIEYQIIFNKGSIMMLPSGVNKASGLTAALSQLEIPAKDAVGIGDGENDHAFLTLCGTSVAVNNAVESLKSKVHWVTKNPNGAGVREAIERILQMSPAEA
jgi:HAD superfamily hydrolase (TIGR01484 family)